MKNPFRKKTNNNPFRSDNPFRSTLTDFGGNKDYSRQYNYAQKFGLVPFAETLTNPNMASSATLNEVRQRQQEGTVGMDNTMRAITNFAQNNFGNAGGDTARFIAQSPLTIGRGIAGGMHDLSGAIYQGAADATGALGENAVSKWLGEMARANAISSANHAQAAQQNYVTDTGRAAGGGLYSLGQQLPATYLTVATGNPMFSTVGAGLQTGGATYLQDRQNGMGVLPSVNHGIAQGVYEAAGEALPSAALAGMAKKGVKLNSALKYMLGEQGGEMFTTAAQGADTVARTNNTDEGWAEYRRGLGDDLYAAAIGGLVQGGGNMATMPVIQAANDSYDAFINIRDFARAEKAAQKKAALKTGGEMVQQQLGKKAQQLSQAAQASRAQQLTEAARALKEAAKNGGFSMREDIPTSGKQAAKYRNFSNDRNAVNNLVNKIINIESSGNATAKNTRSSATGLGQFIGSTWLSMIKKHRPDIYAGRSRDEVLALRNNPALSREMTTKYTQENAVGLKSAGLPVTEGNLYLSHFAGIGGAKKLLQSADKSQPVVNVLGANVVAANPFLKGRSVQWTIDWAHKKMGTKAVASNSQSQVGGFQPFVPENLPMAPPHGDSSQYGAEYDGAQQTNAAARAMAESAAEMEDAARKVGKQTKVYLDEQMRNASLEIMEADAMTPTIAGAQNQYRDRNRTASQVQINGIANNLHPELLGDSKQIDTGAPTLARDGQTIIGGNGRVLAISQAYEQGNGESYKQYLAENAAEYGLNPADILAMKKPVLVRRLNDDVDIAKAAVASNEGGGLGMSSLEQARVDAERLPDFGTFVPSENGELNTVANRGFIRDFVGSMPITVQAQMIGKDGSLSQDGVRRLRNALLYGAYGNSPSLSRMVESTDAGMKNMVNAMINAAPTIAKAKNNIKDGAMHDADISADLVSAVETINRINESGGSVADYLARQGMFEDDLSPVARDLVAFLDQYKRSAKAISTLLKNYYDALAAQGMPAQADVFGDNTASNKQQLLRRTINEYEQQNGKPQQSGIFDSAESGTAEPSGRVNRAVAETEQQPESSRSNEAGAREDAGGTRQGQLNEDSDGLKYSRANDGQRGEYERAKDAGETELTFKQWQQVRTPEFKAWFGDWENDPENSSKVINPKTGEPLVVYHGSDIEFYEFKAIEFNGKNGLALGFGNYFTTNENGAKGYGDKVKEVFLNIKRPGGKNSFNAVSKSEVKKILKTLDEDVLEELLWDYEDISSVSLDKAIDSAAEILQGQFFGDVIYEINRTVNLSENQVIKMLGAVKAASDGIVEDVGGGENVFVVPTSNQIKSATDNNGEFRTDNNDIRFNRNENGAESDTEPTIDKAERNKTLHFHISEAIGYEAARNVDVVSLDDVSRPDNAEDLLNAQGWYDKSNGRITLIADNLSDVETAQFVAWHELGHKRIHNQGWNKWQSLLKQADGNQAVKQLADAVMSQRRENNDAAGRNRLAAVEEALAELYAAKQTGNLSALERKYGVSLPAAFKDGLGGYLARVANRIKSVIADVLGIERSAFTDAEVFGLLKQIDGANVADTAEAEDGLLYDRFEDDAMKIIRAAEKMGLYTNDLSSRASDSEYVEIFRNKKDYDDFVNDGTEDTLHLRFKIRISDHSLPVRHKSEYNNANFEVRPRKQKELNTRNQDAISHTDGSWAEAVSAAAKYFGVAAPKYVQNIADKEIKAKEEARKAHEEKKKAAEELYHKKMELKKEKELQREREYEDFIKEIAANIDEYRGILEKLKSLDVVSYKRTGTRRNGTITEKSGKEYSVRDFLFDRKSHLVPHTYELLLQENQKYMDDAEKLLSNETLKYSRAAETKDGRKETIFKNKDGDFAIFNELGEIKAGVMLFKSIEKKVKPVLEKVKFANGYPHEYTQMMRDYRAQVNSAGAAVEEMTKIGLRLTADERRLISDIIEKELPNGVEVTPEMQELAETIREIIRGQTKQLVELGMISRDSAERFRDVYLPRIYSQAMLFDSKEMAKAHNETRKAMKRTGLGAIGGEHLKGRGKFKEISKSQLETYQNDGWELRHDYGNSGKKAGKVVVWRDYTREERANMGEERDAFLRFGTGYMKTQGDIAKAMLFQRIATNEQLASKTPVEGWTPLPESAIPDTGGLKRYGALAGMYVHPDVAYQIQQQFYLDGAFKKIWRAALGWWKTGKTVYNPVAHVNNVISNMVMTFAAGGRLRELPQMAESIRKKDALYREAMEHGLVGEAVDSAGIHEMFQGMRGLGDSAIMDNFVVRTLKKADRMTLGIASRSAKKMQAAYRVEDEVFKMVLYKRARDKGLSPKEAVDYALSFMFDYSEIPQGVKILRDSGLYPFVSYTYKALPALFRLSLTRPHRMLAVTAAMYGLNALSYMLLGEDGDEEEERKYAPEYQQGYTVFGTPKLIRLPWNDAGGKPMFLDIYRWLPLGDFADTQNRFGGLPLPQWAIPNGPVVNHVAALLYNKDTFTGSDITKPYQSTLEKSKVRAMWAGSQWLPSHPFVPGSYHFNSLMNGLASEFKGTKFADVLEWGGYTGRNYRGEDRSLYRAGLGAVGIKIRGERTEDNKAAIQRRFGYEMRNLNADANRIRRDKSLSESARRAKLMEIEEYRNEQRKQMQK